MVRRKLICLLVWVALLIPVMAVSQEDSPSQEKTVKTDMVASAERGKAVYERNCGTCHKMGIVGAPKVGDAAAWKDRIAKGKDVLYDHSINGFKTMPAKGGHTDLSDEDVKAAVDYMVEESR